MRTLIRFIYNLFGISVYFVKRRNSAIAAASSNTKESISAAMSDTKKIKLFERKENLDFYHKVVELTQVDMSGKTVLDVGCGTGILISTIHKLYPSALLTGMDFSESCLSVTKQKNSHIENLKVAIQNLYHPLEKKYDVIFCTEVLEHLLNPEIALQNIANALNQYGVAIITIPNGRLDFYEGHINFWSIDSLGAFLAKNVTLSTFSCEYNFLDDKYKNLFVKITKCRV